MTSRREFVSNAASAALGLSLAGSATRLILPRRRLGSSFLDLRREPDAVTARFANGEAKLTYGHNIWSDQGMMLSTVIYADCAQFELRSPDRAVRSLHLRWRGDLSQVRLTLGDAWERAYGDLEWRGWVPDRVMPWYFATSDGSATHAYGMRTGGNAFCYWQGDPGGNNLPIHLPR